MSRARSLFKWVTREKKTVRIDQMTPTHVFYSFRTLTTSDLDFFKKLPNEDDGFWTRSSRGEALTIFIDDLLRRREELPKKIVMEFEGQLEAVLPLVVYGRLSELRRNQQSHPSWTKGSLAWRDKILNKQQEEDQSKNELDKLVGVGRRKIGIDPEF